MSFKVGLSMPIIKNIISPFAAWFCRILYEGITVSGPWEWQGQSSDRIHVREAAMKSLYFNQSPTKDIALAMVSMRPSPLGPTMEKLSLVAEKYGTKRRFFVQTLEDRALSADVQEKLVRENPPESVFKIKGSDHCPFFSKHQSLHKILVEIAQIE
ncbi:Putative methylesterase 14, chloroplastic [Linum grandiflorum]